MNFEHPRSDVSVAGASWPKSDSIRPIINLQKSNSAKRTQIEKRIRILLLSTCRINEPKRLNPAYEFLPQSKFAPLLLPRLNMNFSAFCNSSFILLVNIAHLGIAPPEE
jgi:hypothetical protein